MTSHAGATERLPGHRRCTHRLYSLTCLEFDELLRRSGDCCELCSLPAAQTPKGFLEIDHDHRYGNHAVRGLLCSKCNCLMKDVELGKRKPPPGWDYRRYWRDAWFMKAVRCRRPRMASEYMRTRPLPPAAQGGPR